MNIIEKAKAYAIEKHKAVNQKYDQYDYDFHLNMVFETANEVNSRLFGI